MGRFVISRSPSGVRFSLQSENGQLLALSKHYANLDACKKGIASLVIFLPSMPVRDRSAGEGGPNPKCEIITGEKGFSYVVKAPNGKEVLSSPAYATKKACLRAISMLRHAVSDYELLFEKQAGLVPLAMKLPAGAAAPRKRVPADKLDDPRSQPNPSRAAYVAPTLEEISAQEPEFDDLPEEGLLMLDVQADEEDVAVPADNTVANGIQSAEVSQKTEPKGAVTPRLVRLQQTPSQVPRTPPKREEKVPPKRKGIFDIIFKK